MFEFVDRIVLIFTLWDFERKTIGSKGLCVGDGVEGRACVVSVISLTLISFSIRLSHTLRNSPLPSANSSSGIRSRLKIKQKNGERSKGTVNTEQKRYRSKVKIHFFESSS